MPSVIMLSVIMLSVIMLSVIILSVIMLSVIMLSVVFIYSCAECHYDECHSAECRGPNISTWKITNRYDIGIDNVARLTLQYILVQMFNFRFTGKNLPAAQWYTIRLIIPEVKGSRTGRFLKV